MKTKFYCFLQIGEKDFEISFQSDEYKWVLVEVKKAEKIAVTLQTDDERNKADLKTIQEILKRITDSGVLSFSCLFTKASILYCSFMYITQRKGCLIFTGERITLSGKV